MKETVFIVSVLIITISTVMFSALELSNYIEKKNCTSTAKKLGYKSLHDRWSGCILETPQGEKVILNPVAMPVMYTYPKVN